MQSKQTKQAAKRFRDGISLTKVLSRLKTPQDIILVWTLTVSICLTVANGIWASTGLSRSQKAMSEIVQNLMIGLFAAASLEMLLRIRRLWEKEILLNEFKSFFGCDFQSEEQKVALVVAAFPTSKWNEPHKAENLSKASAEVSLKRHAQLDDYGTTLVDIELASEFIAAFSAAGLPMPKVIWDTHAKREIDSTHSAFQTFICIGLSSNDVTVLASHQSDPRLFQVTGGDQFNIRTQSDPDLPEEVKWGRPFQHSNTSDKVKFGLFTKVKLPSGRTIIVCGGIDAEASRRMCSFIQSSWRRVFYSTDSNSGTLVHGRPFAAALEMASSKASGIRIAELVVVGGSDSSLIEE